MEDTSPILSALLDVFNSKDANCDSCMFHPDNEELRNQSCKNYEPKKEEE